MIAAKILIQREVFDLSDEVARVAEGRKDIGGVVSFVGYCRDEGGTLSALELEHYPGMAEEEIGRICDEAGLRWPVLGMTVVHRFGKIRPGEQIVLVIAASTHRRAAFETAEFVMDFLKSRAPFWKKEHGIDGTAGDWVSARDEDEQALGRWD